MVVTGGDDLDDSIFGGLGLEARIDEAAEAGYGRIGGGVVGGDVKLRGAVEHGDIGVGNCRGQEQVGDEKQLITHIFNYLYLESCLASL